MRDRSTLRPAGTPTDQAWIESLNGTIKIENPHLLAIEDPATLRAGAGRDTPALQHRAPTPGSATSPRRRTRRPRRGRSARPAKPAWNKPDYDALQPTAPNETIRTARDPTMLFDSPRISIAKSDTPHPAGRC